MIRREREGKKEFWKRVLPSLTEEGEVDYVALSRELYLLF